MANTMGGVRKPRYWKIRTSHIDPVNGHLLGAGGDGIVDIDVSGATPTFRVVTSASSDGVTVSPDGKTVYNTDVRGFDIATGAVVYGAFGVSGADGMAVISGGALNGDIVVNSNNGFVALLDQLGNQTIIADMGSRGDYASPDRTDGSLLLTQSDSIWRLSVKGGTIGGGGGGPTVPEPSTWAMMLVGFAGLGILGYRRARGARAISGPGLNDINLLRRHFLPLRAVLESERNK